MTPLAFVVSPSMPVLRVSDAAGSASPRYAPVNDGPMPAALRFGARDVDSTSGWRCSAASQRPLNQALREPIPILPIMRAGLAGGDDLHGRVSAANAALVAALAPRLSGEARDYMSMANQFVLNVIMAACAVMIGAGDGVAESTPGDGGRRERRRVRLANRRHVRRSGKPLPPLPPVGPHFPHTAGNRFLPAIGDSAVIDACGFGAAALRYAPEMIAALRGHIPDAYFETAASSAFIGAHPAFPAGSRARPRRPTHKDPHTASCWRRSTPTAKQDWSDAALPRGRPCAESAGQAAMAAGIKGESLS